MFNRSIIFAFVSLFFLSTSNSDSLVLDLKTRLEDKAQLSPVKVGATYYLLKAGYKILDAGEDYAVWLSSYTQKKSQTELLVEVLVEITPTSAIFKKAPLASRKVTYTIPVEAPRDMTTDDPATVFLREKLERKSDQAVMEGRVGGKAVAEAVAELLARL